MSNLELVQEYIRRNPPYSTLFDHRNEVTLDFGNSKVVVFPKNGKKGPPVDNTADQGINFDRLERIGSNGWRWTDLTSQWVGFDIDLLAVNDDEGHKRGLTEGEIGDIIERLASLPYVMIFRSKSGKGIHVFVMLNFPPAANRDEHYVTRKRVLLKLSADLGINFAEKADRQQAGNLWLWSREHGEKGFEQIKTIATPLDAAELPALPERKKGRPAKELVPSDTIDPEAISWLTFDKDGDDGVRFYRTIARCPFNGDGDGQWGVVVTAKGMISASCFHQACQARTWLDLWEHYEGDRPVPGITRALNDPARLGAIIRQQSQIGGHDTVCQYDGTTYLYDNGIWRPDDKGDLDSRIMLASVRQLESDACRLKVAVTPTGGESVANVRRYIIAKAQRRASATTPAPFRFGAEGQRHLMALRNGVVDLVEYAKAIAGQSHSEFFFDPSPDFFTLGRAEYDFDPRATCPKFLEMLWQNVPCPDSRLTLQQLEGYGLTWRTDLQAIEVWQGVTGSGKGVLSHVRKHLIGMTLYKALDIHNISASGFWGQEIIGSRHVMLQELHGEVRNAHKIVSILKSISGQDDVDLDRKNRSHYVGPLNVQFTMVLNGQLYGLPDPSRAFSHRLHYIEFPNQHRGKSHDNPQLRGELMAELPGVFNWAVTGLAQLMYEPLKVNPSTRELRGRFERQCAPVTAWFAEEVELAPDEQTLREEMERSFDHWCGDNSVSRKGNDSFWRDLEAAYPQLKVNVRVDEGTDRNTNKRVRRRYCLGVKLRAA